MSELLFWAYEEVAYVHWLERNLSPKDGVSYLVTF